MATIAAHTPRALRPATAGGPVGEEPAGGRIADLAARGVLAITVLLAAVEIGRIALFDDDRLVLAIVATCAWLPLHLWHLRFGLRSARPPRGGWTLAALAAIQIAALLAIGPAWSMMLAALATSAMIVLRPAAALAALAACMLAPAGAAVLDHDVAAAFGSDVTYLMFSVLFRSAILFTLVWLVAAARRLAASRRVAAADAAAAEARRLEAEMHFSLERSLDELALRAGSARRVLAGGDGDAAASALEGLRAAAAASIVDVRGVVGGARRALASARDADAVALAHEPAVAARGLTRRGARLSFAGVHVVCLGFLLSSSIGLFGGAHGAAAVVLPAWGALAALQVGAALAVARGAAPSWPLPRLLATVTITVGAIAICGLGWRDPGYLAGAMAAATLAGRARAMALAAIVAAAATWETWLTHLDLPDAGAGLLIWNFTYIVVVVGLAIAGLYGAARLISLLDELEGARAAHVAAAVDRQRRRMWADLHDVLGQTLTAISLKADLARRTSAREPARAARELDELIDLTRGQADEIRAIARGDRLLTFDAELTGAVRLLREAGIDVRYEVDLRDVDRAGDALLGFAVREGTTNILRHSRATRCEIRAQRRGEWDVFELRNDGASGPRGDGSGLKGLADRAAVCGGSIDAAVDAAGWFELRVWLPAGGSR